MMPPTYFGFDRVWIYLEDRGTQQLWTASFAQKKILIEVSSTANVDNGSSDD
jgi:regulatory protein YycH of two-component signal transduction system YycFG